MKIAVIADTHAYFDPRLPEMLAGVDAILHSGDVGSQEVMDELGRDRRGPGGAWQHGPRGTGPPAVFDPAL